MSLQTRIIKYLKPRAYVTNVIVAMPGGTPDLLACYRGQYVAIEVKDVGDVIVKSGRQAVALKRIRLRQGYAIVAWHMKDVMDLLERIDRDIDERKMI